MLAALLVLVLSHDAVARGELRRLERFADRLELVVACGQSNLLSDAAVAELRRWPGLVAVELRAPLRKAEAAQLRRLRRLAVRLPASTPAAGLREPSLRLLGPALIRVDAAPPPATAPGPCPGSALAEGSPAELRLSGPGGECLPAWLAARLDLRPEAPGDLPPEAPLAR